MTRILADHAATTRPAPEVVEAMLPWLGERAANASSVHARGEAARDAIEAARLEVARLIGAQAEEIVFTASGSEANNLALTGAPRAVELSARPSGVERASFFQFVAPGIIGMGLMTFATISLAGSPPPPKVWG